MCIVLYPNHVIAPKLSVNYNSYVVDVSLKYIKYTNKNHTYKLLRYTWWTMGLQRSLVSFV